MKGRNSFDVQNEIGKEGESRVNELFSDTMLYTESNEGDLITTFGVKLEVKTDSWVQKIRDVPEELESIFIERFSHWKFLNPGGPWQSFYKHNCPITIHWLSRKPEVFYVYDNRELAEFMDREYRKYRVDGDRHIIASGLQFLKTPNVENGRFSKYTLGWPLGYDGQTESNRNNEFTNAMMQEAKRLQIVRRFEKHELPETAEQLIYTCGFLV